MTDIELVEKYKTWDTNIFWKIFEKYSDGLYKFIYLKVSSQDFAEDILSETFLKCLSNLEKFEPNYESSLKSWIYTIAYNLVKDFYRKHKEKVSIDEIFNIWIEENFWAKIDDKNKLKQVKEFLLSIKQEQREILIMRIWNDLSYKEIAEITWKSVDNCKKIVSRVLKNINSSLAILLILTMI